VSRFTEPMSFTQPHWITKNGKRILVGQDRDKSAGGQGAATATKQAQAKTAKQPLVKKPAFKADAKEWKESKALATAKIKNAPRPTKEAIAKAKAELDKARRGEGRAGGENRGGGSADRRRQRQNLFKEFGGNERGYIVCPWTGVKMHWSRDPKDNPNGFEVFERGKIFVKRQGGGYQLPNLLPESFEANRSRNDAILRK
jgi:hypothetical protein